jgi:mono/diheme cytochrome c family protein
MRHLTATFIFITILSATAWSAIAAEKDPCAPRVPAGELAQFKAMKPPIAETPETIQKGKEIYNGKGACAGCHGPAGKGDGQLAASLNPSPRDLTNPQFKQCKSAGEMFWTVKNGVPGTGMIAAVGTGLISEEEAWQAVLYERSLK